MTRAWVVGGSGMLGSAIRRAIARHPDWHELAVPPLPWLGTLDDIEAAAARAGSTLAAGGAARWAIIWAGGASVTSSPPEVCRAEQAQLTAAMRGICRSDLREAPGVLFFASSAGGIYAGSHGAPFDEATRPRPISDYGRLKLDEERAVADAAAELGAACVLGRIANLYGPGQRLDKPQGLVTQLCLATLTRRPISIYVPLDTLRDYLYVDDCADVVLATVERAGQRGGTTTKVLASGRSVSIASLIGHLRILSKRVPPVVLGTSSSSTFQAVDLRLRSTTWSDLDAVRATGLSEGIGATLSGVVQTLQRGSLAGVH